MESTRESIVGREVELDLLDAFVGGEGRAVVALLEGEAGIGKTALWSAAVDEARRRGARVLLARSTAAEAGSFYSALDDLVRPRSTSCRASKSGAVTRWRGPCCSSVPAVLPSRGW